MTVFCKLTFFTKTQEKEAGTKFVLLSRNVIREFMKTCLHRPMKILQSFHVGEFKNV